MPLLDHFHPPLHPRHPWESFHGSWCNAIMRELNQALRPRYLAVFQVHLGTQIEADVAEYDTQQAVAAEGNGAGGGVAVAGWTEVATHVLPAVFPDDIEVQVLDTRDGMALVAVVEMVSPRNKDRADAREAFAAKCSAYLQKGIGVAVVDVVTSRLANMHNELLHLLRLPEAFAMPTDTAVYAAAYRPVRRQGQNQIDTWFMPLAVGGPLPRLPLWLRGNGCFVLELETSYRRAREDSGL